jgi:hypothetical protein
LISSLPKPKHETLEQDAAIKTIKDAELLVNSISVAQDEPLGIKQDAEVVVDSAEYVPNSKDSCAKLTALLQHQAWRTPPERQTHRCEHS